MHIQKNPDTYAVTLTRKEIQLIVFGLSLHAVNEGTRKTNIEEISKLITNFNNAIKQA